MRVYSNQNQTSWRRCASALLVTATLTGLFHKPVLAFEIEAKNAIIIDYGSRSVLAAKNVDERVGPASMAKLMTLEVVFHALKTGKLDLGQEFKVSEHAWRTGGAPSRAATMFAAVHSMVSVENLIRGITVHTANDACIVLAEGMAGSETGFAELMNERAAEIGMTNSRFTNPTGYPNPEMLVTVADLAKLAMHLLDTYPEFMHYFAEVEFTWNKIRQYNKNPLLRKDIGVDGFLTGYTEEDGFGMVATAKRDGQRIIAVVHGLKSKKDRVAEAEAVLDWAYKAFVPRVLFAEGDEVGYARVFGGTAAYVSLLGAGPVTILVPAGVDENIRARVVYQGPVPAPVKKGQQIGHVEIFRGEVLAQQTPLYADRDVPVGGMARRAVDGAQELLFGYW